MFLNYTIADSGMVLGALTPPTKIAAFYFYLFIFCHRMTTSGISIDRFKVTIKKLTHLNNRGGVYYPPISLPQPPPPLEPSLDERSFILLLSVMSNTLHAKYYCKRDDKKCFLLSLVFGKKKSEKKRPEVGVSVSGKDLVYI